MKQNNNILTDDNKRFSLKVETELLKRLSKFANYENDCLLESDAVLKDDVFIIDSCNVCLIYAKTEPAKRILSKFINRENLKDNPLKPIEDKFKTQDYTGGFYSQEYLKQIIDLMSCFKYHRIKINVFKEYPAVIENSFFKIVLAPIVLNDEEEF